MKCVICHQAETVAGLTSVLLERGQMSLTVTNVPARVCPNCGEAYAEEGKCFLTGRPSSRRVVFARSY